MNDLTILFYTANFIPEFFLKNVMDDLVCVTENRIPIITISQKPMPGEYNICMGDIGRSAYNVYRQILEGAYHAKTEYVVCCEDDTLYTWEHFTVRPEPDVFYYNKSRWILEGRGVFRYRDRTTMCACIANRELIIQILEDRFKKYPQDIPGKQFGEPGRVEHCLHLPVPKLHYFRTKDPIVTFNHNYGLARPRATSEKDLIQTSLAPWGDAVALWKRIHG